MYFILRDTHGHGESADGQPFLPQSFVDRYWLYVVFDGGTPRPRLVKVRDPFGRLLAKAKGSVIITESEILSATAGEASA